MIFILVSIFLVWIVGNILRASYIWNHGVCRKNGIPWRKFDVDSHGDVGYEAGDEVWWNAWPKLNFFKKNFGPQNSK